ncbi:MAG: adenylate/guanylate cyclase domain-containing protein [Dehalococcoidia bacterium]|nr:adenylate/guanylate cyclase domain-containing protein [Dehalococcoidia bacterium]
MKCPVCQFENPADMRFCVECGAKLETICPNCSFANAPSFKFCGKCGQALKETRAPAPVDYSKPQTYTPKFLAEKILSTGKSMEGERKLVTVLFADVAGYTAMSEKLDPEEVHQIMEGCFQILMDEIHRYEGTIDKFTGDGVMALFGAPLAHEDHAQRACYAALAIQKTLESYGQKVEKDCKVPFKMRVGLNSGPVIVGSVGKDLKMDYTAVGDTVNLASRMQTMAEPGRILVSADVYKMARDFFNFKARGKMSVKGKEEAVEAYELLEPTEVASRIEAAALRGLTRFVGREKEMASLREAFDKAKGGSGQVVCIVGEAGVGKSRLLLELRRTLQSDEYTYLEGQCLHYGSSMPYLPLLDILRSYFGLKEGEREFLVRKRLEEKTSSIDAKLKAILPPLQELLSLKVEDEAYLKLEPQKKREKIFEAIRDLLVVQSQRKPLVLAVEDLHWIDKTSEEFLTYFIGHLPNSRILLLLLYRPEYTHQWGSKSCYSQIRVDELPTKPSADLVRAMLEEGEVAPELRQLILNRAAGNPLFMEEFTHTLLENGSIQKKDHQYVLSRKPSEIHVPDTIQGIIAARMDRLDENLKRIMQVASVIGRDFAYRILQTITGMQEELKGHLVNLQGLEFIYEKSLYPELEYVFKHALTQEVAYNSLLLKRRKQIHERIGKAIEELYPDRLEEFCEALAHHYSTAENWEKAFQYLRLSTEKAQRSYSTREAHRYYIEALSTLKQLPDTEENKRAKIDMTRSMRPVLAALGFPEGCLDILRGVLATAEELGDRRAALELYGMIGWVDTFTGNAVEGAKFTRKAFEEAEKLGDETTMIKTASSLSLFYFNTGEAAKIAEVAPKAIASAERMIQTPGYPDTDIPLGSYVALLWYLGWAKAMLGDFDEGEELCQNAIRCASEAKLVYYVAFAHVNSAIVSVYRGKPGSVLSHAREAMRFCEESQTPAWIGVCWYFIGYGHYFQDEFEKARECVERSTSKLTQTPGIMALHLPAIDILLALICIALGDLGKASTSLAEAIRISRDNGQRHLEGLAKMSLGALLIQEDSSQVRVAERAILDGLKMVEDLQMKPLQAWGHVFLGETYAIADQKEKALASLKKAERMSQEMDMDYFLARTEKALEGLKAQ